MTNSFFVTCGRGMEYFAIKELHNMTGVTSVESGDGKVFFDFRQNDQLNVNTAQLTTMKTAERLFLNVFKGRKPFKRAIDALFKQVDDWNKLSEIWRSNKHEDKDLLTTETSSPAAKRLKTTDDLNHIRFRINCKCTGEAARFRSSSKLFYKLSKKLQNDLKWVVNLKHPQLEIYAHWNDEFILVGFPMTRIPISKRPYLKTISLRTTVCWAMAYCADLKPGDIVCDPMCGAGTLLIELIKCWPVRFVIGSDIKSEQLQLAMDNCIHANVVQNIQLLKCSVAVLPVRNESVDAVLCDFPFGLKYGTLNDSRVLLPQALKEIDRICKLGGKIVMLISQQLYDDLIEQTQRLFPRCQLQSSQVSWWKCASKNELKLGALPAVICSFHKRNMLKVA